MGGGCGNVVNPTGFPSFPWPEPGGKGGGDFLFKAPEGPLFGSPFPPARPQAFPAAADFLFATFSFGGCAYGYGSAGRFGAAASVVSGKK